MRSLECGLKAQALGFLFVWGMASDVLYKLYKDDPKVSVSSALFSGFVLSLVFYFIGYIINSFFEPINEMQELKKPLKRGYDKRNLSGIDEESEVSEPSA